MNRNTYLDLQGCPVWRSLSSRGFQPGDRGSGAGGHGGRVQTWTRTGRPPSSERPVQTWGRFHQSVCHETPPYLKRPLEAVVLQHSRPHRPQKRNEKDLPLTMDCWLLNFTVWCDKVIYIYIYTYVYRILRDPSYTHSGNETCCHSTLQTYNTGK